MSADAGTGDKPHRTGLALFGASLGNEAFSLAHVGDGDIRNGDNEDQRACNGSMKLTYYGHSCFAVQIARKNLLFDPFITPNKLAKSIDVKKIAADYILISHGHLLKPGESHNF